MPEKDPTTYDLAAHALAIAIALWGGLISYARSIIGGRRAFSWLDMTIELLSSAFAGLLAYWVALGAGLDGYIAGAVAGVAGHAGTSSLYLLRRIVLSGRA